MADYVTDGDPELALLALDAQLTRDGARHRQNRRGGHRLAACSRLAGGARALRSSNKEKCLPEYGVVQDGRKKVISHPQR